MTVGISLDTVRAFQKNFEITNDWCRSVKPIYTVFSNWDMLCASFPRQVLSSDSECQVDKQAARVAFNILKNEVPESVFMKLSEALRASATAAVRMADQFTARKLNGIVILYQCHDTFLPELCELFAALDVIWQDLALQQIIEQLDTTDMTSQQTFETFLESLHSLIHTKLSARNTEDKKNSVYQDTVVINAIKTMAILNRINGRFNYVPYTQFYNAKVNEHVDIKIDLPNHKERKGFAFCDYPFILNTTVKADILRVESVFQMRHELQDAFFRALFEGVNSPYLVLSIRRSRLIADTLYHLERSTIHDLKKQLRVQFVGEDGVDEGGVQKEFFHLVIRELFDPKYGMFMMNEETRLFWFSPDVAQEGSNYAEYKLAGLLLGLAVYNAVVLDLHMPLALYKKLMGYSVGFEDLQELDPSLSRGLKQLLNFDGDVASEFERTFQVDIRLYDKVVSIDLVRDGSKIYLNNDNRKEFVELYANFILNKSVEKQFNAFAEGFQLLCQDSAINMFRPEELQQLLCGSSDLDFYALEKATVYDGGWTRDSPVIKYFWEIVHEFSYEEKKKLLFFATGSDRAPIGGLGRLQFVIAKNGADSERLPTSHTCYNVLLLSEYNSKEKLRERLLTSISNAEGFGMI